MATDDKVKAEKAKELIRKGAEKITEDDLKKVAGKKEDIRSKFDKPGPIGRMLSDVNLLLALIQDYITGDYRKIPVWAVSAIGFSLLYVVSPLDFLPDLIPLLGQVDDIAVITICLLLIEQELHKYREWRYNQAEG